jgi:IstB-like ATP binding protein.
MVYPTTISAFAQTGEQRLFHLIGKLYERRSIIVTTNLAIRRMPQRV